MSAAPQLALDFTRAPYAPGSHTSRLAAQRVTPSRGEKARIVLDCIRAAGTYGRTRHELAGMTGYPLQSICSLVNGLMATRRRNKIRDPLIMVADHTRPSPYGHEVEVLVTYTPGGTAEGGRP